jgi:hypothetical protein
MIKNWMKNCAPIYEWHREHGMMRMLNMETGILRNWAGKKHLPVKT